MKSNKLFDTHVKLSSPWKWAITLFIIGFSLAALFSFIVFPSIISNHTRLDPDGYGRTGQILYETGQFQSISKAPLYPVFVALISWLSGSYNIWHVQFSQCILFALTTVVFYLIFQRILSSIQAKYAGLLCAIYPISIWYVPRLWTEVFLTFTIALFTLSLIKLLQKRTIYNAINCGIMVGIAALSKGIAIVFLPLTVVILLTRYKFNGMVTVSVFLLGALTLIAPWTFRNWQLKERFLPIHANGGYNFYLGNGFTKYWHETPFSYVALKEKTVEDINRLYDSIGFESDDPVKVDDVLMHAALADMRDKPYLIFKKLIFQSLTFWYLAGSTSKSLITGLLQIPILLLAIPGIIRMLKSRDRALCLLIPVIGIFSMAVIIFSFARLSATVMPYILGIVVYGLYPMLRAPNVNSNFSIR